MLHPELKLHLQSLTRVVYYVAEEEDRAILEITNALDTKEKSSNKVFVYNSSMGVIDARQYLRNLETRSLGSESDATNAPPHIAFDKIYKDDTAGKKCFYIILDPERWMADANMVRRFLNIVLQVKLEPRTIKNLIFVSNRLVLSPKLQQYVHVVRDSGLNDQEIESILGDLAKQIPDMTIPKGSASWFRGLNTYEIECAVSQNVIKTKAARKDSTDKTKRLDRQLIGDYKKERMAKTDLLQIVDCSDTTFDKIGGVDRFKAWVEETRFAWTKEGQDYGLQPPKGVLCAGVWGCGKSLSVKALGAAWKLPVVQLELGKLRSSAVGSTEENVYRVTQLLESMAPCIAWVDEAEKSFAGAASSNFSDAGTTSRTLGILSTWHQETTKDVCLAMTANSLKTLPPEFINRIEERFFFDLPSQEVRMDILKIHLLHETHLTAEDIATFPLLELAKASDNLVPREMWQAVKTALRRSFFAEKPKLDADILLDELKTRPRILRTMDAELKEVLDWVGWDPETQEGVRARFASSKQSNTTLAILKGGRK
jgi:SpoVK/Ycf46/Vps4 family AAA+-type ATPase